MADQQQLNGIPRTASKSSVDKAIDLLKTRARKSGKHKLNEKTNDRERKINNQCIVDFTTTQRRINASSAFLHTHAIAEMRNALINHDWNALQEMFPILLKCLHVHTIAWRYAFLINLFSPLCDLGHFQEFFEMCISKKLVDNEFYLEKLMSLQSKIIKN